MTFDTGCPVAFWKSLLINVYPLLEAIGRFPFSILMLGMIKQKCCQLGTQKMVSNFCFIFCIFKWKIIALLCSVGFYHATMWISSKYTYISSTVNLTSTDCPSSLPSRLSQSTRLNSLSYKTTFPQSSTLHMAKPVFRATLSICSTLSFPQCAHKFVFYICISIPALERGSSGLFF